MKPRNIPEARVHYLGVLPFIIFVLYITKSVALLFSFIVYILLILDLLVNFLHLCYFEVHYTLLSL